MSPADDFGAFMAADGVALLAVLMGTLVGITAALIWLRFGHEVGS